MPSIDYTQLAIDFISFYGHNYVLFIDELIYNLSTVHT